VSESSREYKSYKKGEIIFKQGDPADCMYDIRWGSVGIYLNYGTSDEKMLAQLRGDDIFGEMGLVDEAPRSATAVAGFRLERVLDWVGKIDESGEIIAEATVVEIVQGGQKTTESEVQNRPKATSAERPKLDLSSSKRSRQSADNNRKPSQQGKKGNTQKGERKGSQQGKQQGKGKRRG